MTKTTSAIKARQNLGQLLEEAYYRGDEFVIERAGKPMAALVPIEEFRNWQAAREKAFAVLDEVKAANKNVSPEQVEKDVAEAIEAVRKRGK